jgi:hypothetical protein
MRLEFESLQVFAECRFVWACSSHRFVFPGLFSQLFHYVLLCHVSVCRIIMTSCLQVHISMTRAIGDYELQRHGLTPEPTVSIRRVAPGDTAIVLARFAVEFG